VRDLPRAGGSPHDLAREALSKAPPAILMFWVVKICATTVGETGGDAVSMSLKLGYLVATAIFLAFFAVTMIWQVASKRYHSLTYWLVVVATTTVGTTTSDFIDRTLHVGYVALARLTKAPRAALCANPIGDASRRLASGLNTAHPGESRDPDGMAQMRVL